jgi:glucosylceramidase
MMKSNLLIPLLLLISCSGQQPKQVATGTAYDAFKTEGKKVIVYMTADSTAYRLSPTDTIIFSEPGKTSEKNIYVFADPTKTFQSLV